MALSTMAGRIRLQPDGYSFSIIPLSLPNGTITRHYGIDDNDDDAGGNNKRDGTNDDISRRRRRRRRRLQSSAIRSEKKCHDAKRYNLSEILCPRRDFIVDHCWTVLSSSSDNTTDFLHCLIVLTRQTTTTTHNIKNTTIMKNNSNNDLKYGGGQSSSSLTMGSAVSIYHAPHWTTTSSSRFSSCSPSSLFLGDTIILPHLPYRIVSYGSLLAVGHSSGISLYTLRINGTTTTITTVLLAELLPSYPIHAISMTSERRQQSDVATTTDENVLLMAASGDRLTVWCLPATPPTSFSPPPWTIPVWTTRLTKSLERVTSMDVTPGGRLVALSFWDGVALVFRRLFCGGGGLDWEIVSGLSSERRGARTDSPPWESPQDDDDDVIDESSPPTDDNWQQKLPLKQPQQYPSSVASPTFVTLIERPYSHSLMIISTPHSGYIKCFDLETGKRCRDGPWSSKKSSTEVHGIISLHRRRGDDDVIMWIDERDVIHLRQLPMRNVFDEYDSLSSSIDCFVDYRRIHNGLFREGPALCVDDDASGSSAWVLWDDKVDHFVLRCAWGMTTMMLDLDFLTVRDVVQLVQRCRRRRSVRESFSFPMVLINDGWVVILVPRLSLVYVYHRHDDDDDDWTMIDIEEEDDVGIVTEWRLIGIVSSRFLVGVSFLSTTTTVEMRLDTWNIETGEILKRCLLSSTLLSESLPLVFHIDDDDWQVKTVMNDAHSLVVLRRSFPTKIDNDDDNQDDDFTWTLWIVQEFSSPSSSPAVMNGIALSRPATMPGNNNDQFSMTLVGAWTFPPSMTNRQQQLDDNGREGLLTTLSFNIVIVVCFKHDDEDNDSTANTMWLHVPHVNICKPLPSEVVVVGDGCDVIETHVTDLMTLLV